MPILRFRSIWISDLHLGTKNQQDERLLDFLQHTESTHLYLVGDILDLLQAQKKWHWPPVNDRIVQTVIAKAARGTTVFYLPGNHDHLLRQFNGRTVCGVHIRDSLVHETVDQRRYLVVHGDRFDPVVRHLPWLAALGSLIYEGLLAAGSRRRAGAPAQASRRLPPARWRARSPAGWAARGAASRAPAHRRSRATTDQQPNRLLAQTASA